jgi:hypothetical protein
MDIILPDRRNCIQFTLTRKQMAVGGTGPTRLHALGQRPLQRNETGIRDMQLPA